MPAMPEKEEKNAEIGGQFSLARRGDLCLASFWHDVSKCVVSKTFCLRNVTTHFSHFGMLRAIFHQFWHNSKVFGSGKKIRRCTGTSSIKELGQTTTNLDDFPFTPERMLNPLPSGETTFIFSWHIVLQTQLNIQFFANM